MKSTAAVLLPLLLALGACATLDGASGVAPEIPSDAVETIRTESNGDVVSEYRVGTELLVVKVTPARGPVYYLYDRDRDGIVDPAGDHPPMTYYKLFEWK